MRRRVEQGQPNQALTLFAPLGMAEDLTKVQLILCKEIKAELQTVKETIANIPFEALQKDISEATTNLENRMCSLEKRYNELKRTDHTQNYTSCCYRTIKIDSMGSINHGTKTQSMDKYEAYAE